MPPASVGVSKSGAETNVEHAGRGVDRELGRVRAARDRVGQRRAGIGVGRRHRGDGGRVLRDGDRSRGAAAVRGDRRRIVVDVGDGDGDVLGVGVGAVGDLHGHVVDVVGAGVGRGLEVGGRDEGQHAGRGVDREQRGVRAARDRVGQRRAGIGVGRRHRGDGGRVLRDATAAAAPPPFDVIAGALSLTLVTVTAMSWVSVLVPSETCTVTS